MNENMMQDPALEQRRSPKEIRLLLALVLLVVLIGLWGFFLVKGQAFFGYSTFSDLGLPWFGILSALGFGLTKLLDRGGGDVSQAVAYLSAGFFLVIHLGFLTFEYPVAVSMVALVGLGGYGIERLFKRIRGDKN